MSKQYKVIAVEKVNFLYARKYKTDIKKSKLKDSGKTWSCFRLVLVRNRKRQQFSPLLQQHLRYQREDQL